MPVWEWYFGLPPARPGQGTDWNLRWSLPGIGTVPAWVAVLLLLGLIVGVALVYRRDAAQLPIKRQLPLLLLRLVSLLLVLVMLGHLTLAIRRTGLPTLALAIDCSASMGLEDSYRDRSASNAARALADKVGESTATRLAIIKGLLLQEEGRLLQRLQQSHRVQLYRFDADAWPVLAEGAQLELRAEPDSPATLAEQVRNLVADGVSTRPLPAVRSILEDLRGSSPSALLLFSDGITTTGDEDRFPAAGQYAHAQAVPLLLLGVGSEEAARDLQLTDVLADDVAFVGDPVTFSFLLKHAGYADETSRVTLREASSPTPLATTELTLTDTREPSSGELTYTPGAAGDYEFEVAAEPLAGESTTANNSLSVRLSVRKEQLRVLLVDRVPRWEYRHLKAVLERDPAIELHCVLQEADAGYAVDDRSALRRFPVNRDELFANDVIILGDAEPAYFSQGTLDDLRDYVASHGGGLVLIAGERHHPHDYRGTPLEDLLPVEIGEAAAEPGTLTGGFLAELTPAGSSRAVLRLADTVAENRAVWGALPPLYWCAPSGRRKPGAETLVVHPGRFSGGEPLPLIVTQRFGAGQVVYHATDELWRWRERVEDRYYGRYWLQLMRYLSRSRLRVEGQTIELTTDRSGYQPGESVEVRVRFFDQSLIPGNSGAVAVVVEGPGGLRERVVLTPLNEAPFLFTGRLPRLGVGDYRAWLAEPVFGAPAVDLAPPAAGANSAGAAPAVIPSVTFQVEVPEGELQNRRFQQADLVQAARISQGSYAPFWQVEQLIAALPPGKPVPISAETAIPLWNRWEVLLGLVLLLTVEWIFRKRSGLV